MKDKLQVYNHCEYSKENEGIYKLTSNKKQIDLTNISNIERIQPPIFIRTLRGILVLRQN
jgi:hypothetical protein